MREGGGKLEMGQSAEGRKTNFLHQCFECVVVVGLIII